MLDMGLVAHSPIWGSFYYAPFTFVVTVSGVNGSTQLEGIFIRGKRSFHLVTLAIRYLFQDS